MRSRKRYTEEVHRLFFLLNTGSFIERKFPIRYLILGLCLLLARGARAIPPQLTYEEGEPYRPTKIISGPLGLGGLSWDGRLIISTVGATDNTFSAAADFIIAKTVRIQQIKDNSAAANFSNTPFLMNLMTAQDVQYQPKNPNCLGTLPVASQPIEQQCRSYSVFTQNGSLYDPTLPEIRDANNVSYESVRHKGHMAIAKDPSAPADRPNPYVCDANSNPSSLGGNGLFECYDILIVAANVPGQLGRLKQMEVATMKVSVHAFASDGSRLAIPFIEDGMARIIFPFTPIQYTTATGQVNSDALGNPLPLRNWEPSLTAEGRLLVFQNRYAYNFSSPFNPLKWVHSANKTLESAHTETAVFGNLSFQELYPFAAQIPRNAYGEECLEKGACFGAYNWISQDGADIMFTKTATFYNDGIVTPKASFSILGRRTNWTAVLVDSLLNKNRYGFTGHTTSPGFTRGNWAPYPEFTGPAAFPYTRSTGVYPIYASRGYDEVNLHEFSDREYLIYLHMNEMVAGADSHNLLSYCPVPPTPTTFDTSKTNIDSAHTADTSGNFRTAELMTGAEFPFERFNKLPPDSMPKASVLLKPGCIDPNQTDNFLSENDGFIGKSISFLPGGHLKVPAFSVPEQRKRTITFAINREQDIPAGGLQIATHGDAWNLFLTPDYRLQLRVRLNNGTLSIVRSNPIPVSVCTKNQWCHFAIQLDLNPYKILSTKMFLNGTAFYENVQIPLGESFKSATADLFIGPRSNTTGTDYLYRIDEFTISRVLRSDLEIKRLARQSSINSKFVSASQINFPASPGPLLKKILNPIWPNTPESTHIPVELKSVIESGVFDVYANLGSVLFADPNLNVGGASRIEVVPIFGGVCGNRIS